MEALKRALPFVVPACAVAGVAVACKYAYNTDIQFRNAVHDLFGISTKQSKSDCNGGCTSCSGEAIDACCGDNSGGCCGDASGGCCGDVSGGCCEGDEGNCGCGDDSDGHVLTANNIDNTHDDLEDIKFDFEEEERPNRGVVPKLSRNLKPDVGFLPAIYVKTFGCSHNTSDSEFMAGILAQHGYPLVSTLEECELTVINSCTVKNPSQDAFVNLVKRSKSLGKKIVVAGCVPQADREELPETSQGVSAIGVAHLDRILEVVDETLKGNCIRVLGRRKQPVAQSGDQPLLPSLDLPKVRKNRFVEIIPLSTGCLGACTYCKTKHARGKLGSYAVDQILRRVKTAIDEGVSEIWMTSEDTGAYGIDLKTDIGSLLLSVTDETAKHEREGLGPVMLRLGMTNPPYMLAHKETLAKVLNLPNVFSFVHIPVQSGSDAVLERMVREYTREDFDTLVDFLRENCPHVTIATDIICGFPGETEEDHKNTLELLEKYKFPVVNISQFYPRAGTSAANMKRVDTKIVKRRSTEVTKLFDSYTTNDWLEGMEVNVWFNEHSSQSNHTVGHTREHVKVLVERDEILLGQKRKVRITKARGLKWHVEAEIIHH